MNLARRGDALLRFGLCSGWRDATKGLEGCLRGGWRDATKGLE